MIVLIANNTGAEAKRLRGRFRLRIGHIYSPAGWRTPWPIYALDNGAFTVWRKGGTFDDRGFLAMCHRTLASGSPPRWVAVPDVVCDRDGTLAAWQQWEPTLRSFGWPLAMVVQDGMTKSDVPANADVIFVGGSKPWKWETAAYWCEHFPHVHIGRVNTESLLWRAHHAGAKSCDGTGWFRGDRAQLDGLWYYLADSSRQTDGTDGPSQPRLFGQQHT